MRALLKRLAGTWVLPLLQRMVQVRVERDFSAADGSARRLMGVLVRVLRDDFPDADREWFVRVEALRARLAGSTEPVRLVDYGAGSPDSVRTVEEMQRGVIHDSSVGELCRRASKSPFWARLLFAVVREYRPQHGIELGTCRAVSASYQGGALRLSGTGGTLRTLEGADVLAAKSRQNLSEVGLDGVVSVVPGRFDQTLDGVLHELGSIDYAFIDGHHDERATLAYFHQLLPVLSSGALQVFDDIRWSAGMKRAWQTVCAGPRVAVSLDLRVVGICLLGVPGERARHYRYLLP